ncbi:DNA mismatch endonuclease Vsr [Sphingomonas sabuli]|uniref:Very short patch repair endonuclease n=1 Tax=Sphingomonas sabuli TaxID=2764186 RepID=A0A7G9L197_9SPHN|nr:very short patch repair endonuclease [Sphingomonas sabuli]QNM82396.1 DNA mismatch endonuclease Vsr [Sphingomonas sabuli]
MADRISAPQRSENMRRIKGAHTKPEMIVRRMVHSMGRRYRLHRKHLPGNPDLVFGPSRKVIFVHGCFWHQHTACKAGRVPSSNSHYWHDKLRRNVSRDAKAQEELKRLGWEVLTVWDCETRNTSALHARLEAFLSSSTEPGAKR